MSEPLKNVKMETKSTKVIISSDINTIKKVAKFLIQNEEEKNNIYYGKKVGK